MDNKMIHFIQKRFYNFMVKNDRKLYDLIQNH